MTQKIALSLALFATLGMTACTVDAPTTEDFNYSFLEELPPSSQVDHTLKFRTAADSHFTLSFRDSVGDLDLVDDDLSRAIIVIDEVQVASLDSHGKVVWRTVRKAPFDVDLMKLASGDVQEIVDGPLPTGEYVAVAMSISESWVVQASTGKELGLKLPGAALLIKETFELDPHGTTDLAVEFAALGSLEFDGDNWSTEPVVSLEVDYDYDED